MLITKVGLTKIFLLVFIFIIYFIFAVPFYSGDVKNHLVWANSLLIDGTLGFYDRVFHDYAFPNYPPGAMILFAVSLKLYYLTNQLVWFLNVVPLFPSQLIFYFQGENVMIAFLKLPAILAHFGIVLYLYLTFKRLWVSIIFLINPSISSPNLPGTSRIFT